MNAIHERLDALVAQVRQLQQQVAELTVANTQFSAPVDADPTGTHPGSDPGSDPGGDPGSAPGGDGVTAPRTSTVGELSRRQLVKALGGTAAVGVTAIGTTFVTATPAAAGPGRPAIPGTGDPRSAAAMQAAAGSDPVVTRSQLARLEPINLRNSGLTYGGTAVNAYCDGTSHPLSTIFPTLAAARSVFPNAGALTDEIDYWVLQTFLVDGKSVNLPNGTLVIHQALSIPNGLVTGLALRGAGRGVSTIKIRDGAVAIHTGVSTTSGSTRVGDRNAVSTDVGRFVSGSTVQTPGKIVAASPGVGYTLSVAATGTSSSGQLAIGNASVICDRALIAANYDSASSVNVAESHNLTISGLTVDGNKSAVGAYDMPFLTYGIGLGGQSAITIHDVEIKNCLGWGYREQGTSRGFVEYGMYDGVYCHDNTYWGFYLGYRNRKKSVHNLASTNNGTRGLSAGLKGYSQNPYGGGVFLDASEMTVEGVTAHANNGDGIFIRNVYASSYASMRATNNGGFGIHTLGLLNCIGSNWLAQNNGTNPGNGQNNAANTGLAGNGVPSGGAQTATGAVDLYWDDSADNYGITDHTQVTGIVCGVNTAAVAAWPGAETQGIWVDDRISGRSLRLRAVTNTSGTRLPANATGISVSDSLASLVDVAIHGTPRKGDALVWNGTAWAPAAVSGSTAATTGG